MCIRAHASVYISGYLRAHRTYLAATEPACPSHQASDRQGSVGPSPENEDEGMYALYVPCVSCVRAGGGVGARVRTGMHAHVFDTQQIKEGTQLLKGNNVEAESRVTVSMLSVCK